MGFFYYLNAGLIYLTIGFACAIYFYFVLRRPVLGKFWGALVVGVIGSLIGGVVDQLFSEVMAELVDFQSVNVIAALISSMVLIWILAKVSSPK